MVLEYGCMQQDGFAASSSEARDGEFKVSKDTCIDENWIKLHQSKEVTNVVPSMDSDPAEVAQPSTPVDFSLEIPVKEEPTDPSDGLNSLLTASSSISPLAVFDISMNSLKQNLKSKFTEMQLKKSKHTDINVLKQKLQSKFKSTLNNPQPLNINIQTKAMLTNEAKESQGMENNSNSNPTFDSNPDVNMHKRVGTKKRKEAACSESVVDHPQAHCTGCDVPFPKMYNCKECGGNFRNKLVFRSHQIKVHDHTSPYVCSFCGKKCVNAQTLKAHEMIHSGEHPFHCDMCGAKFSSRSSITIHMQNKHIDSGKTHRCV
ncbi:UNVERIFIED_CONTAM: hypothetical protein B566_EDAN019519, partial [Ephemera danica]